MLAKAQTDMATRLVEHRSLTVYCGSGAGDGSMCCTHDAFAITDGHFEKRVSMLYDSLFRCQFETLSLLSEKGQIKCLPLHILS